MADKEQLFVTWSDQEGKEKALNALASEGYEGGKVERSQASRFGPQQVGYKDVDTNINVRPTFTRDNYETFRPEEALPVKPKDKIRFADNICNEVGLISNVVDLMADFSCQGIDIVHTDDKVQALAKSWFKKVNGPERSERFLNLLYRLGNVPVMTNYADLNKIDLKYIQDFLSQDQIQIQEDRPVINIPWSYKFIHPCNLQPIGGPLAILANKVKYGYELPADIKAKIKSPKGPEEQAIVDALPKEIKQSANSNGVVPFGDNFSIFFYKKDDWEIFARPMIEPIFRDVVMLEKLRLADIAACDSAIGSVRLWTLGDLAEKILPTPAGIARLSEILSNNVGGGSYDLIWGPELKFTESQANIAKFLGQEKYVPTLNSIYAGLGIPPTLTGSASSSGFSNNYISLKTLTERLEYGRRILLSFWNEQIKTLQKALGLKEAPRLIFSSTTLSDEAAEKRLLIDLLDRNIISDETVLNRFGELNDIEKARMTREKKARDESGLPQKASPFYNSQTKEELTKLFVQGGTVTPSQVGIKLAPKKAGEELPLETKSRLTPAKPKGKPGQGRPMNSKDGKKRKKKRVLPRTTASFIDTVVWAKSAQDDINTALTPYILGHYGKSNARMLTTEEAATAEDIKFGVLSNLEPFTKYDNDSILGLINTTFNTNYQSVYNKLVTNYIQKFSKEPSLDNVRQMQLYSYALINGEDDG